MFLQIVRKPLGVAILAFEKLFKPHSQVRRTPEQQARVDAELKELALYQFLTCPFCVKVRRELARLGIALDLRDAQNDETARHDLSVQGGKAQVPCLRIEEPAGTVRWLYESNDIIAYLRQRFA